MTRVHRERWVGGRGRPDPRIGPSLFIAIPLPDAASAQVADLVAAVRRDPERPDDGPRDPGDVRWVRMTGLHLTVRFLGPTPRDRIPAIEGALDAVASAWAPFAIRLAGTGAFPTADRPRALWLGVTDGAAALGSLAGAVSAALAADGWPVDDRPFRAHLTLARSDGVRSGPAVVHALAAIAQDRGFAADLMADRLVLFESRTGQGAAARYEPLHEAILTG